MTKTMNEQTNNTLQDQILKILFAEGIGKGLANIAQILMDAAMLIERENHIRADPYQRCVERNGHASSGQVSNLNKQLDEEFAKWRARALPEIRYLILDAT